MFSFKRGLELVRSNSRLCVTLDFDFVPPLQFPLLIDALSHNNTVQTLLLDNRNLNEAVDALGRVVMWRGNTSLRTLDLSTNDLGDRHAAKLLHRLQFHRNLRALVLRKNQIGDCASIVSLFACPTLRTLDLGENQIRCTGASQLARALTCNTTLTWLCLRANQIGVAGAIAFADALRQNTALTHLGLSFNCIANQGAVSLAECLHVNTTLTALDVEGNGIGLWGLGALSNALRQNRTLVRFHFSNSCCYQFHDDLFGVHGVRVLSRALRANCTLQTLSLKSAALGVDGAQALAVGLQSAVALRTLDLSNNRISDAGVQALMDAFMLNGLQLRDLNLASNRIALAGSQALAQWLRVNVSGLHTLNLSYNNNISDKGMDALATALCNHSALIELLLDNVGIGFYGARALATVLKSPHSRLRRLHLKWNQIGDGAAVLVADALRVNCTLTTLHLSDCPIADKGAAALANALRRNTTLRRLYLDCTMLRARGAKAFANALMFDNRTLQTLSLLVEPMGERGALSLARALCCNRGLQSLTLHTACVSRRVIAALISALRRNAGLLDVESNRSEHVIALLQRNELAHLRQELASRQVVAAYRHFLLLRRRCAVATMESANSLLARVQSDLHGSALNIMQRLTV